MKPPSPPSLESDPLDPLAEAFLERLRRGEQPALTEYTTQHPDLAERIRKLFPALMVLEELGSVDAQAGGSEVARAALKGQIPPRLGEYRILREVGRGGMGIVYEAVQESLGRHVALKVLPFHSLLGPTRVERFRREAKAAARLHHTNIVPVFGVGEQDGIHYYAMQFISGQGVDDVLKEVRRLRGTEVTNANRANYLAASVAEGLLSGQFPDSSTTTDKKAEDRSQKAEDRSQKAEDRSQKSEDTRQKSQDRNPTSDLRPRTSDPSLLSYSSLSSQPEARYFRSVAEIGIQVADALAYAHREGVLHRDVKPSNLLLDTSGQVWVTDFGLAKAEDSDDLTQTGDMVGTLCYMAPERFQGPADSRSDVYGLGVTLYEMLTLQPAFAESNRARLIERIAHHEPMAPRKLDGRIPRDLETIVLKAMAKEPALRYSSADALAQDLRRVLADRPIQARRTSPVERIWRWCRRNPAVATLIGLVAGLVLAVALVALWDDARLREEHAATLRQLKLTGEAEADATRRLQRSYVEQARASRLSGRLGRSVASLKVLDKAGEIARDMKLEADILELRNETIACLAHLDLRLAKQWPGHPPNTTVIYFDSMLERYARADRSGFVSIRRTSDDSEIHRLGARSLADFPLLSPDGQYLAHGVPGERGRVRVFNLAGREPVEVVPETACSTFEFSPDSRWVAIGQADGAISLLDLLSRRVVGKLKADRVPIHLAFNPRFSVRRQEPVGRQLAVVGANCSRVQIFDLETGEPLPHGLEVEPYYWIKLAWHPDGKALAVAGGDKIIYLWDVATGKQKARLEGHKHTGVGMVFNHAGDLLASTGWDSLLFLWDPRTGKQLFRTQASVRCLRFSPDDSLLAATSANNELQIWEVVRPFGYRTLVRDPLLGQGTYWGCAVSSDNRLLAAGMDDGVALWDLISGRPVQFLPMESAHWLLFEPSRALLINCSNGVRRFSIQANPTQPSLLQIVAAPTLPTPGSDGGISCSADGRVIATAHRSKATLWRTDRTEQPISLRHEHLASMAVSPDGNWLATCANGARSEIKIWEARDAKPVHTLLLEGDGGTVGFSPDGKWLAAFGNGLCLWKVPSWEKGHNLTGYGSFAFSPDSKLLALESGSGAVRLVDPSSGEEYAQFEDPSQDRARSMAFSPDGTQLVVNGEGQSIHIWDLRVIREQLAQRGLDWDLPP
jgi:serine/threonine protein kinase/WD40 repeat protein